MNYNLISVFIILIIVSNVYSISDITCRDNNNQSVDWWVMLKLPKGFNEGQSYYYYDSNSSADSFTFNNDLNDLKTSPLLQTIFQIKNVKSEYHYNVMWNDQPFDKTVSATYAHSKGIIGGTGTKGFIINHSTPKFPVITDNELDMDVESTQRIYGQHYFCMSADINTINEYAKGLTLDRPWTMAQSYIPTEYQKQLPNLVELLANKQATGTYTTFDFKTLDGFAIKQFAKSGKWEHNLYWECVAPTYKLDFYFETWGRSLMPADCSGDYQVKSNLEVYFTDVNNYSYTQDHSKYGISTTSNIVCFGDINRMTSQFHRGGGTNCFPHQKISDFLRKAFIKQQDCETAMEYIIQE